MKKILIIGSNGLVGQKIRELIIQNSAFELMATSLSSNKLPAAATNFQEMDFTQAAQVNQLVESFKPHIIINCAGMTQVDACEINRNDCWKINYESVMHLIQAANASGAKLIQLSTDFVFDGSKGLYSETDEPNPVSFYGVSKWEAEKMVHMHCQNYAIVRTVLVYGVTAAMTRSNLILWVKESLEAGKKINVVDDQYRTPTLAEDLAFGTLAIANSTSQGIFHIAGNEYMSVYEIAHRTAEFFNLDSSLIKPITSLELKQPGKRPAKTGFNISKAQNEIGFYPRSLVSGLQLVKEQLDTLSILS